MKIEVKIVSEVDAKKEPEGARRSVSVEVHSRRGETFNVDLNTDKSQMTGGRVKGSFGPQ